MKVFYNSDYTSATYAFDTTRKSGEVAKNLRGMPDIDIADPTDFYDTTDTLISTCHGRKYVKAVKTGTPEYLAESQGFTWDKTIYPMARAHAAGLVAAVNNVLTTDDQFSGSLSSGLHHASTDSGAGFCTFNGLAIAAQHARNLGAQRILVLDFDAHCGGGTYEMTRDLGVTQLDVSTNSFDSYRVESNDKESQLHIVTRKTNYIDTINIVLDEATALGPWDLVIYNSGMDPYNDGIPAQELYDREVLVAEWAKQTGFPTIFAIAGGYTWHGVTMDDLVRLHSATPVSFLL